ncbi:conserved hypothetical protein [Leifsonia xyli subsp. xyli str. CTCB07]|uniref:Uncharacterized protein n=1 Tax=Leifsonia xyli subsp. xyli (strain CTCB07) TaxID=281090 RepID=Q6AD78_LEIXX|nr:conserved hypothetical protein [Leifsonia xyli subsp. xyli str. CTCB07]
MFRGRASKTAFLSRGTALRIAECLSAVTVLTSVAEYLVNPGDRRRGGLNAWETLRQEQRRILPPVLFRLVDVVSGRGVSLALTLFRGAASMAVLSGRVSTRATGALHLGSAIAQMLLGPRTRRGSDGSDQAVLQTTLAVGAARAIGTPRAADIALTHLALQATLAYQASGWAKIPNPDWGSGKALTGVMRTRAYGDRGLWRVLHAHPGLARTLSRGMLGFECAFALVLLRCPPVTWLFTLIAAGFHIAVGATMGLGRFVTAFPAMLVAVPYVFGSRRRSAQDRSVPLLLAGAIAAGVTAGAVSAGWHERRWRDERSLLKRSPTSAGTTVSFSERRSSGPGEVCFVLFPGLGSLHHDLTRWASLLSSGGRVIVLADALGGQSLSAGGIEAVLRGLCDFVSALPGRVVLVGHSLGACVAGSVAARVPGSVSELIRVDPTDPAVVDTDPRTNPTLKSMHLLPATLLLSGGLLFTRPGWVAGLPGPAGSRSWDAQRTPSWWRRTAALWRLILEDWAANGVPGPVEATGVDIWSQLVSAQLPADEPCENGRVGLAVRGCDHHSILSSREHAETVAALILEHVEASA